jgi:hypothetical protein
MNFHFSHDFDIDVANYWKIFLSEEFSKEMFADLKMKKYEVSKREDDGKRFVRVQTLEPTTPIPSFLTSLIKSTAYTEYDDLDWATNTMKVDIKTAMFQDKFKMGGNYTVTPLDGGKRCRREFKGEVKVSIALIGGRIEKYMLEQMRDSYETAAATTRRWIAKANAAG